jgi:hypothetical protein
MINQSFSLEGEDRIALSILRDVQNGTYMDIGCAHPVDISNTYLLYTHGWRGVCVDGREDLRSVWSEIRPEDKFVGALCGQHFEKKSYFRFPNETLNTCDPETASRYMKRYDVSEVSIERLETRTAKSIWTEEMGSGSCPNLVSIDVEGFEIPIIRGLIDESFRPDLLIIETKLFNFNRPLENPIFEEMLALRYSAIAKTPLDCFFVNRQSERFSWIPERMIKA